MTHRLVRLQAAMEERGWEVVVASGPAHVAHLTGYARYYSGPSAVLVEHGGRRTLFLPASEAAAASMDGVDEIVGFGVPGFGLEPDPQGALERAVAERVAGRPGATAGPLPPGSSLDDAGPVLAAIRRRKDADELERILAAYDLCWTGQRAIAAGAAAGGASEIGLFSAAQAAAQAAHGAPVEFVADVLTGARTASVCCPAAVAGPAAAAPGDPVLADVSLCAAGYWGDTAETHGGGALREALVEVLDATAAELRPGRTGDDVFAAMHERIAARFPGGAFPHHGGHGLGVTAHEPPHLVPGDATVLEAGQVLALEPGIYLPGEGARVEELHLVSEDGGVELRTAFGRPRGLAVSA